MSLLSAKTCYMGHLLHAYSKLMSTKITPRAASIQQAQHSHKAPQPQCMSVSLFNKSLMLVMLAQNC